MKTQQESLGRVFVLGILLAGASGGAATLPLSNIFTNTGATTATNLWQYAANNHPTYYTCTQSNDSRYFRGVFTPASSNAKLAIHSDDGSTVAINGQTVLSKAGQATSLTNMASSFNFLSYSFSNAVEYCVEVTYQNGEYTAGDQDGVTLYAYDGGGSARSGPKITGADAVCVGNTLALAADCGAPNYSWSSGNTGIATVNSSGVVTGVSSGSVGITVTDTESLSGSKTIYVVKPGISPSNVVTSVGVTNTFVLTNSAGSGTVAWNPQGTLSPNTRTNKVAFPSPGTINLTASYAGCSANATITAVAVASLTANVGGLCGSGQVIYTAQSSPAGYETMLSWSGEGLSGTGAKRTNNYSTTGPHVVSVSCGTSVKSITNTVYKIDIAETTQTALADSTAPVTFSLTNSYGPATWQIGGSGPSFASQNTGNTVSINPGSTAGNFTITAYATALSSCTDTATLQVVKVAFSTNLVALCEGGTSSLTITVTPSSAVSLLSFDTMTNTTTGPTNTHASVTVNNGTNLTITGSAAGTAYLRAKLGNTVVIGPTLQIVRVTFPPEAWYVGVGKSADFTATVIPPNASVIFDTASSAIATATAITGGVRVTGVAPGTTQVRAKAGGGSVCSTKDVTAVRVKFPTNAFTVCNGSGIVVDVSIEPPGTPVTFTASDPNIVQVTAQGTNVTIVSLTNGKTTVNAKLGTAILDSMLVTSVTIAFPPNDWLALRGVPQKFDFTNSPEVSVSEISFTIADPTIATVAVSPASRLIVTGLTNGTTTITASIFPGQSCATKAVTIFSAQLQTVEFTSDHNLICSGSHVTNAGSRYPTVEWNPGAAPPVNAPMTHTAGDSSRIEATVVLVTAGLPGGTVMSLFGDSSEPALVLGATNSYGSGSYAVPVQGLFPLGKEMRKINAGISWSLNVAGNALALGNSGPHQIYTTLGTPITSAPSSASVPNIPRLELALPRVVNAIAYAGASPNAYTCYPRIVWHVVDNGGTYSLANGSLTDVTAWELPVRAPRDCIAIARFARNVCMVMGVPGAFEAPTYMAYYRTPTNLSRPNTAIIGDLSDPNVSPGSQGTVVTTNLNSNWILALADINCRPYGNPTGAPGQVGGSGGLNGFEATVVYTDLAGKKWYFPAGAGGVRYDNPDGAVRLFTTMVWVIKVDHDGNPATQPEFVVQAVEHTYTSLSSLTDAQLCP